MADPPVRAAAPAVFRPPTGEDLVTAVLTGDAAVRPIRAMFRAAAPQDHVRGLLVQAVDPLLLKAVLGPDIAPPWVSLLERYYAQARRRSPATFLDFDRAWADQRRRWQPLADGADDPGAAQEAAVEPDTALDVPGRGVAADRPVASGARRASRAAEPAEPSRMVRSADLPPLAAEALAAAYRSYDDLVDVFDPWQPEAWQGLRVGSRALSPGSRLRGR